jgi:hypothetical protein
MRNMDSIDSLLMTLINAIICITLPLVISKLQGFKTSNTAHIDSELASQEVSSPQSRIPQNQKRVLASQSVSFSNENL